MDKHGCRLRGNFWIVTTEGVQVELNNNERRSRNIASRKGLDKLYVWPALSMSPRLHSEKSKGKWRRVNEYENECHQRR